MKTSFPKEKIKVLLLEGVHDNAVNFFKDAGYTQIEYHTKALAIEDLKQTIADAHIVGIRSKTQLTKEVLDEAKKLMAIACFCIGTNQVDLEEASKHGIAVFNSPYSNTRSVAELVLAESVMLMRRITERSHAAHQGVWMKDAQNSYELRGKTLGIIGYGHIGSQVSILAEAFGMRVLYHDIVPKLPLGNAKSSPSLDELIKTSDIITMHVPADASTKNLVDAEFIGKMKKGSYFLNLSRGSVVDIDALAEARKSGHLSGLAVDVYPVEPKSKDEKFISPLQGLDNTIITPHIGGSTQEAQENIGVDAASKLVNYLDKGSTVGSHTVPELSLPIQKGTHRILHIHKNVPGVLTQINSVLSDAGVNILGQFLKTNENVGYVVLDVDSSASETALEKVKQIEETIRARVLY